MDAAELRKVLADHNDWLQGNGGSRADLSDADLRGADLRYADLRYADLSGADLRYANLRYADLSGADLRDADLSGADLRYANLRYADLRGADLRDADLRGADLRYANLRGADLRGADLRDADLRYADLRYANLRGADLRGADLRGADLRDADLSGAKNIPESTAASLMACPEVGEFTGWKKCRNGVLVQLLIPADARRSSATSRKCRAEFARVVEVFGSTTGYSDRDPKVVYREGETVRCHEWDDDRWNECSGGIHFFITRAEAEAWR